MLFSIRLPQHLEKRLTLWLQVCGKTAAITGMLLVLVSHSARVHLNLNTRLPGLISLGTGLFLYALYAERMRRVFGTAAAVSLSLFWPGGWCMSSLLGRKLLRNGEQPTRLECS